MKGTGPNQVQQTEKHTLHRIVRLVRIAPQVDEIRRWHSSSLRSRRVRHCCWSRACDGRSSVRRATAVVHQARVGRMVSEDRVERVPPRRSVFDVVFVQGRRSAVGEVGKR